MEYQKGGSVLPDMGGYHIGDGVPDRRWSTKKGRGDAVQDIGNRPPHPNLVPISI